MPEGEWQTWLIMAGRGFGKTRTGAETVRREIEQGHVRHVALIAETPADARDIMIEGESGLLNVCPPWMYPEYQPTKRRLVWPNGAIATVYSGANPDLLRGPQHDFFWADELAAWKYPDETWDNLQFGLRLGDNPRGVVTTTPRPIPIIKRLIKDETTHVTRGSTHDNKFNLPASFFKRILSKYEGTRLGQQEIYAEVLDDAPGALWKRHMIKCIAESDLPPLKRVVVAVDPAASHKDDSDETGIIVAGVGFDGNGYVLADRSCIASPNQWGTKVVGSYHEYEADRIVPEVNNGGDMVTYTIKTVDKSVPVKPVRASRGKYTRAEPVAALYEQGKVYHVGSLARLEDQLCTWEPGMDSPDRMDALVWALSDLMLGSDSFSELMAYYKGEEEE